jgi:23S rRNA A2030 N6-methylase RlmJ
MGSTLCNGYAQNRPTLIELKPKQIQTLPITLEEGEVAQVHLHVEGGLMGVRANLPGNNERPY